MIPRPKSFAKTLGAPLDLTVPLFVDAEVGSEPEVEKRAQTFREELRALGFTVTDDPKATKVELRLVDAMPSDEAYRLNVGSAGVVIEASALAGLFYGTRAFVTSGVPRRRLLCGTLEDAPRYQWRGAHLDVARHFFPVEALKRFIDLLALHKMNIFHWHLTEDQGWRIEIDAFPRLTQVAAFRKSEGGSYGGFYTKDEVREVVAYASERFVTVVPEIEMPGHAVAALAAYPELSCSGGPFEVETNWGVFDDVYCVGNDDTLAFLEQVFLEVIDLFPGEYFHIGGDECLKIRWKTCPKCQARIQAEGLKDEDHLQAWIVSRMSRFLKERGKRLVGWDEILEGGLAEGATVMSWRGTEGGVAAARLGHDVVMTPITHCYLDYRQSADEEEPGAWFAPALDLPTVYSYQPTPEELSPEQTAHILGVQGNIWTEKIPTFKHLEYMVFPRLCALAEVAWSPKERDFSDFETRLSEHYTLLDLLEVGYRGSPDARPVMPSVEDRERYLRAREERERKRAVAAY